MATITIPVFADQSAPAAFTCEMNHIRVSGCTPLTSYRVRLVAAEGGVEHKVFIDGSLYADASGHIDLFDVQQLLEPYVLEAYGRRTSCTLTVATTDSPPATILSEAITVEYGRIAVPGVVAGTLYFPTLLRDVRHTAPGRMELLTHSLLTEGALVRAEATYYDTATHQTTRHTFSPLTFSHPSNALARPALINATSDQFELTAFGTLVSYDIVFTNAGVTYLRRYHVNHDRPAASVAIAFINSFGVPEVLYCTGTDSREPTYERQTARLMGILTPYDIRENDIHKTHTGPLRPSETDWATEALRATQVWQVLTDGALRPIVVTECEARRNDRDDSIAEYVITWQPADGAPMALELPDGTPVSNIFDITFDYTFE